MGTQVFCLDTIVPLPLTFQPLKLLEESTRPSFWPKKKTRPSKNLRISCKQKSYIFNSREDHRRFNSGKLSQLASKALNFCKRCLIGSSRIAASTIKSCLWSALVSSLSLSSWYVFPSIRWKLENKSQIQCKAACFLKLLPCPLWEELTWKLKSLILSYGEVG